MESPPRPNPRPADDEPGPVIVFLALVAGGLIIAGVAGPGSLGSGLKEANGGESLSAARILPDRSAWKHDAAKDGPEPPPSSPTLNPPFWAPPALAWSPLSPGNNSLWEANNRNDCEAFYAFGDSYTAAHVIEGSDLLPLGQSSFVNQYRQLFDADLTVDHNIDGGGKGTLWAQKHIERGLPPEGCSGQTWMLEFGVNDLRPKRGNLTAHQIANGQGPLVDLALGRGASVVWFELPPLPYSCPVWRGVDYSSQRLGEINQALREAAWKRDLMTFPVWDATDLVPGDGIRQEVHPNFVYDCVHPNDLGYKYVAAWLREFLGGGLYHAWDEFGHVRVEANYTQTLIIPLGQIDKEKAFVFDLTQQMVIPSEQGVGQTIRFEATKGHSYIVAANAIVRVLEQAGSE